MEDKEREARQAALYREKLVKDEERRIVKERVDAARRERAAKFGTPTRPAFTTTTTTTSTTRPSPPIPDNSEALLQIRLPTGETLRQMFHATDAMASVVSWVSVHLGRSPDTFTLLQPLPRVEFTGELLAKPLVQLGLAPRGALTVINVESRGVVKSGDDDEEYHEERNRRYTSRRHYSQEYSDEERSDDEMSYERLLELGERIGSVSTGASAEQISALPETKFNPSLQTSNPVANTTCPVCQMDFENGDMIRTLPCLHFYHTACIDKWLASKKTCPTCMQRIDVVLA
eukprot:TRINITY_DN5036_c0_g1_i1.p1 TRINITY_DN5036_c0_g1~~TRINITY_DN5036_c0_g1_i1.p1  ORF type:complete len:288 (-),score=43.14 TRINITY_DN5036_c0_g1_i1:36-899(-)